MSHQNLEALKAYETYIQILAKYRSEIEIENFDSPHASIVIKNIADISKREVLIYDNDLSGDLSGNNYEAENFPNEYDKFFKEKKKELLESFHNHLEKGQVLKIVVRDGSEKDSEVYKKLNKAVKRYPVNLSVLEASPEFTKAVINARSKDINFVVGDSMSYRIEPKTADLDNVSRKAVVCFYGPKLAKVFREVFEANLSSCKPVF